MTIQKTTGYRTSDGMIHEMKFPKLNYWVKKNELKVGDLVKPKTEEDARTIKFFGLYSKEITVNTVFQILMICHSVKTDWHKKEKGLIIKLASDNFYTKTCPFPRVWDNNRFVKVN